MKESPWKSLKHILQSILEQTVFTKNLPFSFDDFINKSKSSDPQGLRQRIVQQLDVGHTEFGFFDQVLINIFKKAFPEELKKRIPHYLFFEPLLPHSMLTKKSFIYNIMVSINSQYVLCAHIHFLMLYYVAQILFINVHAIIKAKS